MDANRTALYCLAAGLFDQPDEARNQTILELIRQLAQLPGSSGPWRTLLVGLAQAVQCDLEEAQTEYARLFILSFPEVAAQPYGSYWLEADHRLFASSTEEVARLMGDHGVVVDPESGLLPDHLVAELEFMAFLADQGEATWSAQRRLFDHLARWVPPFLAALRAAAPSPRYSGAADLLERLLDAERAHLQGQPHPPYPVPVSNL